jgi:hypothetical protein
MENELCNGCKYEYDWCTCNEDRPPNLPQPVCEQCEKENCECSVFDL